MNEEEQPSSLFNANVDINLRILRIAAALIVKFEVGFVRSSAAEL